MKHDSVVRFMVDLTFMGPCIVSIFYYICNKMQRYTVYLYLETALHVSSNSVLIFRRTIVLTFKNRASYM